MRVILILTEINNEKIYDVFDKAGFGNFFIKLLKNQYHLLQIFI